MTTRRKPENPFAIPAWIALLAALAISCNLAPLLFPLQLMPSPVLLPTSPAPTTISTGAPISATPASLPTPTPPPQASSTKRLVGYYASWNIRDRNYHVASIPADRLTHVNYAFLAITQDGLCTPGNAEDDQTNLPELQDLRQVNPALRLLVSIGGGGSAKSFSLVAKDGVVRQRFVQSCLEWMIQNGFDGIDVDWEYPAPAERQDFYNLLAEFRTQIDALSGSSGRRYLFTIAAGASPYQYNDFDPAIAAGYVDWINLMTYDYKGPWSKLTGFNAPLYANSYDASPSSVERNTFNDDAAVTAYLAAGVPADKIVMGIPFYGRGWKGVPAGESSRPGLYQSPEGPAQGTWGEAGAYDFRDIQTNYLSAESGYIRYWDSEAQVPWLYNPADQVMISYDDPESMAIKADYANSRNLGGIMIWQLGTDDEAHSLVNTLYSHLYEVPAP